MKIDTRLYTNIILTIIAILLGFVVFKVNINDLNFIRSAAAQGVDYSSDRSASGQSEEQKTFGGINRGAEFQGIETGIHEVAESNKLIAEALKDIAGAISKSAVTKGSSSAGTIGTSGAEETEATSAPLEGSITVKPPKSNY